MGFKVVLCTQAQFRGRFTTSVREQGCVFLAFLFSFLYFLILPFLARASPFSRLMEQAQLPSPVRLFRTQLLPSRQGLWSWRGRGGSIGTGDRININPDGPGDMCSHGEAATSSGNCPGQGRRGAKRLQEFLPSAVRRVRDSG